MSDQPGFPGPSNFPQQPPQPQPFGGPPMQPGMQPPIQPPMQPGGNWAPQPTPNGSSGRTGLIIAVVIAVAGLSVAGWLITRDNEDKAQRTLDTLDITVPNIDDVLSTAPTIPNITIPEVTIPGVTVPVTIPVVPETAVPVETTVPVPETTLPAPPPAVNLFDGTQANDVVVAIAAARGASPLRILEVNLYPTYAFAQVQDPSTPANIDEYGWRSGVQDPSPVQLIGDGDLESNLFSDNEVNWASIPGLVGAALAQIPIEGAQVTHVHIARNLPFTADVQIRVFVDGTRNSGYLDADAQGNIITVSQS